MKKFLFCSFGNIQQRHFRNLKKLSPNCKINVYLPNVYDKYRIFDDRLNISFANTLLEAYSIDTIFYGSELDKAIDEQYDAVFIGTLPPNRVDIAIKCAMRGLNIFIEKPLSNNLDGVYKLWGIIEDKNLKCAVGFQMRFSPIIEELKQMVDDNIFGDIYRIEITHANNIRSWTKGRENLGSFYALKEATGGGVLLSQIHEIDYLTYLFGKHYPISAIYGNYLTNSDVEDSITILSNLEKDYCIPIIINLDFISTIPRRTITIYGLQKTQTFDLMPINPDKWNGLFIDEMSAFINYLGGDKPYQLATLEDGIASLEYCMDIKNNFMKVNMQGG